MFSQGEAEQTTSGACNPALFGLQPLNRDVSASASRAPPSNLASPKWPPNSGQTMERRSQVNVFNRAPSGLPAGLDDPWKLLFLGLQSGVDGNTLYQNLLELVSRLSINRKDMLAPDKKVLHSIRAFAGFKTLSERLLAQEEFAKLPVGAIERLMEIMHKLHGKAPDKKWRKEAQAVGKLGPRLARQFAEQAQLYNQLVGNDPVISDLLRKKPDPWNWTVDERKNAMKRLTEHAANAQGVKPLPKITYNSVPQVQNSLMVTNVNTSEIQFYPNVFKYGFLTLLVNTFHEMVHVRQNAVVKPRPDISLAVCLRPGLSLASDDEIQKSHVQRLLQVAHRASPANRYEMSWGTLSESMAYRAGLQVALTSPDITRGNSFLSHVSRSMQEREWKDDPWEATQREMEQLVSSKLGRPFQLQSLVTRTNIGRLQLHPEAYSILNLINHICKEGEHTWHGPLILKALMAIWPDVVRLLDDDTHPDYGVLRTVEKALPWATQGRLDSGCATYAEGLGLHPQVILKAHQNGTLIKQLEHLIATSSREDRLGASQVLGAIELALSSGEIRMRHEDFEIYRSALGLTVAPSASQDANSSMSGSS